MIDRLREEIIKESGMYHPSPTYIEDQIVSLLRLKYLCDNGEYEYKDAIKNGIIDRLEYTFDGRKYRLRNVLSKLVVNIQYEDLAELIKEYVNQANESSQLFNYYTNKLCIPTDFTRDIYDITGNTTYVVDRFLIYIFNLDTFKFFDKVLGINNKYVSFSEVNVRDFDTLYIYDNRPKNYANRNQCRDFYDIIHENIHKKDDLRIILHTDFKKISNLKPLSVTRRYLRKVVLFEDETSLLYFDCLGGDTISIINYDKNKVKTIDKLIKIIENNKKQKDVLIKITLDDIQNNQYRIGFRLYQEPRVSDKLNINDLVDENTKMIERLSKINERIEQEINKLINR